MFGTQTLCAWRGDVSLLRDRVQYYETRKIDSWYREQYQSQTKTRTYWKIWKSALRYRETACVLCCIENITGDMDMDMASPWYGYGLAGVCSMGAALGPRNFKLNTNRPFARLTRSSSCRKKKRNFTSFHSAVCSGRPGLLNWVIYDSRGIGGLFQATNQPILFISFPSNWMYIDLQNMSEYYLKLYCCFKKFQISKNYLYWLPAIIWEIPEFW